MGRKAPRYAPGMPRHGVPHGCRCTRTFLGAPPTPRLGVSEAKLQTRTQMRRGNELGLFDIVSWELPKTVRPRAASSAVVVVPAPARGASQFVFMSTFTIRSVNYERRALQPQ